MGSHRRPDGLFWENVGQNEHLMACFCALVGYECHFAVVVHSVHGGGVNRDEAAGVYFLLTDRFDTVNESRTWMHPNPRHFISCARPTRWAFFRISVARRCSIVVFDLVGGYSNHSANGRNINVLTFLGMIRPVIARKGT